MNKHLPTIKYTITHIFYWACYNAIFVYASYFLLSRGFNNSSIGYIIATGSIFSAIIAPIIGSIIDRKGLAVIYKFAYFFSFLLIICSIILLYFKQFLIESLAYIGLITFIQVLTPLLSSLAIAYISKKININYGFARGLGSLSYALTASFLAIALKKYKADLILYVIIILNLCFILSFRLCHFKTDSDEVVLKQTEKEISLIQFVKSNPDFVILLIGFSLIFFAHNVQGNYLYQIVKNIGYGEAEMGYATTLAGIFEIPTILCFSLLNKYITSGTLLKISLFFYILKAFLFLIADNINIIYFAMTTQIFGFAVFASGSIYYIYHVIEKEHRNKAQALMQMTVTIGAVLSGLLGGQIIDNYGIFSLLSLSLITTIIGTILVFIFTAKGQKTS